MKILFPEIILTPKDRETLITHITGYNRLNDLLLLGDHDAVYLKKLLMLEVEYHNRPFIVKKLVGRILSIERRRILTLCSNQPSKNKSQPTLKRKIASLISGRRLPSEESPTE